MFEYSVSFNILHDTFCTYFLTYWLRNNALDKCIALYLIFYSSKVHNTLGVKNETIEGLA